MLLHLRFHNRIHIIHFCSRDLQAEAESIFQKFDGCFVDKKSCGDYFLAELGQSEGFVLPVKGVITPHSRALTGPSRVP